MNGPEPKVTVSFSAISDKKIMCIGHPTIPAVCQMQINGVKIQRINICDTCYNSFVAMCEAKRKENPTMPH